MINHKYKYEREVGCRSEDGGGQRGNAQNSAKMRLKWLDRFEEITQAPLKNMDSIPAPHRPKASRSRVENGVFCDLSQSYQVKLIFMGFLISLTCHKKNSIFTRFAGCIGGYKGGIVPKFSRDFRGMSLHWSSPMSINFTREL